MEVFKTKVSRQFGCKQCEWPYDGVKLALTRQLVNSDSLWYLLGSNIHLR